MEMLDLETDDFDDDCDGCSGPEPIDVMRFQHAIRAIMGKWKIEIICSLVEGPRRFGNLRRALPGITQHMLTAQLKELASNGIVIRTDFAEKPPRVEYELSQAGIDLLPTFVALRGWSVRYGDHIAASV